MKLSVPRRDVVQKAPGQHLQPLSRDSSNSKPMLVHTRLLPHQRRLTACGPHTQRASSAAETPGTVEDYNATMQRQMGWEGADPYQYQPERGLYFHEVFPSLFCGSQPRSREDVDQLAELLGPKGSILSLQQDKDLEYWGVSLHDVQSQAHQRRLHYLRRPTHTPLQAQDFDPHSLRSILPGAVKAIQAELSHGRKVYVHCTAGLGRAPAACIAYMYWFHHFQLEGSWSGEVLVAESTVQAYKHLTDVRPCGPNKDAIRGATFDLLDGRPCNDFQHLPPISYSELNHDDRAKLRDRILHHA